MIERNLPVLVVVVPLIVAIIVPLVRHHVAGWAMACAATVASFACSVALLQRALAAPTIGVHYALGGWLPPFGIEYTIDAANGMVATIVSAIAAVVTIYARRSVAQEIPDDRQHFFWSVWLLCITGLLGITVTGDAFNAYVLLEISSLATYTLVAMGRWRNRRALTAAINYLVLGTIGASFILLGIGYLYMQTGTLNMADIAAHLQTGEPANRTVIVGVAFLLVGFAIKLALFPLHLWLPDAYTFAPSAVSALLAATATKVAAYITIRFLYTVVGPDIAFSQLLVDEFLLWLAAAAIIVGSMVAIRQRNVKRLLAWSSLAQIGYITLGLALANKTGLAGSLLHVVNHALMKGGLFLALGCVVWRCGGSNMEDLRGLGRRMPLTMAAFTAGGLGLIGVPLTAGFVSKWYLVQGAIASSRWAAAFVVLVGSLLAAIYVWKLVEAIWFAQPTARNEGAKEAPLSMLICTWVLIGASIWFGVDASLTAGAAETAAGALLQGATP